MSFLYFAGLGLANGVRIGVVIAVLIIGACIQLQLVLKKQGEYP